MLNSSQYCSHYYKIGIVDFILGLLQEFKQILYTLDIITHLAQYIYLPK